MIFHWSWRRDLARWAFLLALSSDRLEEYCLHVLIVLCCSFAWAQLWLFSVWLCLHCLSHYSLFHSSACFCLLWGLPFPMPRFLALLPLLVEPLRSVQESLRA